MTKLETKVKRFLRGKNMSISGLEYHQASKLGLLCGIVGCRNTPTWKCPRCGSHYCNEHKQIHFDVRDVRAPISLNRGKTK